MTIGLELAYLRCRYCWCWFHNEQHQPLGDVAVIQNVISMLRIKLFSTLCDIALRWMPQNIFDDKSILVRAIGWYRQARIHYLHQCWPGYMSPYSVTRPLSSPKDRIYASANWVSIGSGNGLSPVRCQAITWTNADLLSIGLLGTTFSEIRIGILSFSFKKMQLKYRLPKWRPFCPDGDGLIGHLHAHVPMWLWRLEDNRLLIVIRVCRYKA